jgi:ASCH domain
MTGTYRLDQLHGIPALSVRQPWAELILQQRKTIEVREWSDPYRGPLWLHTGQKSVETAEEHFHIHNTFKGGFVGLVTVLDIVTFDSSRWEQWRSLHLVPGPPGFQSYAWLLSSPVRLDRPVPARGHLRLFNPDAALEASLLGAVPR